jgi:GR25 family glycosyltransferase involved in LPS biosynthesis
MPPRPEAFTPPHQISTRVIMMPSSPSRSWTARTIALAISLPHVPARRANAQNLIDGLPVSGRVIDAVDGKNLTVAQRDAYQPGLHRPRYPFRLNDAEIACFLSHRSAWESLLASDADQAIILEDDAIAGLGFNGTLDRAMQTRDAWCFLQLHSHRPAPRASSEALIGRRSLPQVEMVGQVVTRRAARALLAASERFDRPVDSFIQLTWLTDVPIHHLVQPIIANGGGLLGGSTIARRQPPLEKLWRTLERPIYKASLRLMADWHAWSAGGGKPAGIASFDRA